ncbi:MAG: class I SAM-dependent methyltransferase [Bacteroidales bacterium]|nr:class I SAM-dependent methyltransferase [Bacteroidales bacterium]
MDFRKFYDTQPDYEAFRNDPEKRAYYDAAAEWKVRKLAHLVPGYHTYADVLEVGCAFGVLLNMAGDKLKIRSRTGIDISSENIEKAAGLWPACTFFMGTLDEFLELNPPAKHRFDLVILSDIVEHVPDDLGFLKSAARAGRYVLLNLPLEKSYSTRKRQYGETDPSGHLRAYDREMAVRLAEDAGFKIVADYTDIAFFDRHFYRAYVRNRRARLDRKPLPLRIGWKIFYFFQDRMRRLSRKLSNRIWGSNYFALLESSSR